MKMMTVGRLKAQFSQVLDEVDKGETIGIEFGRQHKPLAKLVPFTNKKKSKRPLGLLKGKGSFSFVGDGKITDEEFLNA